MRAWCVSPRAHPPCLSPCTRCARCAGVTVARTLTSRPHKHARTHTPRTPNAPRAAPPPPFQRVNPGHQWAASECSPAAAHVRGWPMRAWCVSPPTPACPPCIRGARVAVARTLTSRPPPTHLPSPPRLPPPAHTHTHTEHPPHPLPRCWQPGARARARGIAAAICSAPLPRPPLACLLVTRRGVCAHTAGTQQQHRVTHRCHTGPAFVMRIPRVAGICEAGNDCLHLFQRSNLQEVPGGGMGVRRGGRWRRWRRRQPLLLPVLLLAPAPPGTLPSPVQQQRCRGCCWRGRGQGLQPW